MRNERSLRFQQSRVGPAADKPRRPTVLQVRTWWAGARVACWSHPTIENCR